MPPRAAQLCTLPQLHRPRRRQLGMALASADAHQAAAKRPCSTPLQEAAAGSRRRCPCRHQQSDCKRLGAACGPAALQRPQLGGAAAEVAEHAAHVLLGDGGAGRLAAQRRQDVVGEVAHAGRQRTGLPGAAACQVKTRLPELKATPSVRNTARLTLAAWKPYTRNTWTSPGTGQYVFQTSLA